MGSVCEARIHKPESSNIWVFCERSSRSFTLLSTTGIEKNSWLFINLYSSNYFELTFLNLMAHFFVALRKWGDFPIQNGGHQHVLLKSHANRICFLVGKSIGSLES